MKVSVPITSASLKSLLTAEEYSLLTNKVERPFNLTIQNLGATDIFLERGASATISDGYMLAYKNEVEISIKELDDLNLISETSENTDVRIITT